MSAKKKINEQAIKVFNFLSERGGRSIRYEIASDKRFTLDFYIQNGRLIIVQAHKDGGVEIFRPLNEKNDMSALLADLTEYLDTGYNDPSPTK